MTNFIQTRSFDQRNGQGGFAIGLILLVVLLIAVIVGAIAIASRSSSTSSNAERDRVTASALTTVAQTVNNAFSRANQGAGLAPNRIYISYSRVARLYNDTGNLIGPNGFMGAPSINTQAYNNPAANCPANPGDGEQNCQFWITRLNLNHPNGGSTTVYTKPLLLNVARQINAVLWNSGPADAVPGLGGGALNPDMNAAGGWGKNFLQDTAAADNVTSLATLASNTNAAPTAQSDDTTAAGSNNVVGYPLFTAGAVGGAADTQGVAGSRLPTINGAVRPEGAFVSTVATTGNVYFRVLDNL
jgi:hypothetical protein